MTVLLGIFAAVAGWEVAAPRRELWIGRLNRWFSNFSIIFFNSILLRLIFPVLPLTVAVIARERGWGIMNYFDIPVWLAVPLGLILLDLVAYLQHVMFHTLPILWRLHLVHHADIDVDVTTGLRFHPMEVILFMIIRLAAVSVIGPDPLAVAVYEIALGGMLLFGHGNVRMVPSLDRALRFIAVTPDMHRVHHSSEAIEANGNFGFILSWWDRLFGTYREQPAAGHEGMTLGLAQYRDPAALSLPRLMALPFVAEPGGYDINGRSAGQAKRGADAKTR
ncbi:MAG: sterol desaturase family protein [Spirochaetes bacterium]|nr:sterol desaturase family protein [Spirochaetota bacterium]